MPPRRFGTRDIASWILWSVQFVFAVLHFFPSFVYRVGGTKTTTMVVAYVNDLGPFWILGFGFTAIGLLVSILRGKHAYIWHLFCGAVFVGYTTALFIGALFDQPHGPITYPILAVVVTLGHFLLALSYGGDR